MRNLHPLAPTEFDYLPFGGGMDITSPVIQRKPGTLRESQNYEIGINGGYTGTRGYERFDGRTKPSDGTYGILNVTITGSFAVGNTITGATSAATAVVLAVVTSVTPNYLVVTKISGTFVAETLNVGGSGQGTITAAPSIGGASTTQLHAQYLNLAADNYRADITDVTGTGSILGICRLAGVTYAFRNNAGGTAVAIYKSSTSGWTNVPLGEEISFTAGSGDIDEGDTLTKGGVTATIKRVVITSGTLAAGTAAGRLIIYSRAGGNYTAGAATTTGAGALTLSGAQTAITITVSGRYEFDYAKFGTAVRAYGCDGVNRGFEFDGTDYGYVPITTGMSTDTPTHVKVHAKHLFFSFAGSAQHSGTGTPYVWSVVSGAAEIAVGEDITGFATEVGAEGSPALGIYSKGKANLLYGTSSANWLLVEVPGEIGARAYSLARTGPRMFMSNRGITNLSGAPLSYLLQSFVNARRNLVRDAIFCRGKNQYRIFFSDSYALYVTLNQQNKIIGMMPQLMVDEVTCALSVEDSDGTEVMMFGSDDGFVYQMDKGTSFDGDAINRYLVLNFHHSQSPRFNKSYKNVSLEVDGGGYAEFSFSYELGYISTEISQPIPESREIEFSAGHWDTGVWDSGFWDRQTLRPENFKLEGTAENISLIIRSESDYFEPIQFSGALMTLLKRRKLR